MRLRDMFAAFVKPAVGGDGNIGADQFLANLESQEIRVRVRTEAYLRRMAFAWDGEFEPQHVVAFLENFPNGAKHVIYPMFDNWRGREHVARNRSVFRRQLYNVSGC